MRPPGGRASRSEAGYSLVALIVTVTVMMVMMGAAVPSWRYLMKNDHEEELLFRGAAIADAIQRYQKKNGGTLPPSLEVLVKGRLLRKAYKDPMTKDGKWRLIRQGEAMVPGQAPGPPGARGERAGEGGRGGLRPGMALGPAMAGSTIGGQVGVFMGVASTSTEKSLRVFNGREKYSEWLFVAGQPRIVGRQAGLPTVIGPEQGPKGPRSRPNR
jgi:type II secretory pathway pseudopilin PulG